MGAGSGARRRLPVQESDGGRGCGAAMAPRSAACLFGVGCSCALTGRGSRHRQRCAIAAGCEALRKAGLGGRVLAHVATAAGVVGFGIMRHRLAGMRLMLAASRVSRSGLSECHGQKQQCRQQQAQGHTRKGAGRAKHPGGTPYAEWQCRAGAWGESMLRLHGHLMPLPPAGRSSPFVVNGPPLGRAGLVIRLARALQNWRWPLPALAPGSA